MPKTAKYLIVIVSALLMLVIILRWKSRRSSADDAALVRWGGSKFTVSEEAYYRDRITGIIGMWIEMGQRAERDEEGQPREPYATFLVLDPDRRAIWIEDRGQVLEECRSELPARMTWAVYHDTGAGANSLSNVVRLKYRGFDLNRHHPEIVWLAGQRTKEYLAFHLTDHDLGSSYTRDGGPFRPYRTPTPLKQGVPYYRSLLVSDAEYEQARQSWANQSEGITPSHRLLTTPVDENKAAWEKVKKKLYQALEGQVSRTEFHLRQLQVEPGPDYSAAHAQMQVAKDGFLQDLLGRSMALHPYLTIDYLGDDVWYAKIAPNPQHPLPRRAGPNPLEELPLEFLVSADQAVPSSARQAWIEKGRERQKDNADSPAQWTATLANGVVVQFLGVCEYPSEGKRWWGPDGRPIDYAPGFRRELESHGVGDRRVFEIAWRIQRPDNAGGTPPRMSVQYLFENGFHFGLREPRDRYGSSLLDVQHNAHVFEKSQEKATLTVGADLNNQGLCRVKFKNLSLVPGQNQGFEMEVVK